MVRIIKFKKLTDTAKEPTKGSRYAAGWDLYADTDRDIHISPGDCIPFYTGLAFEIPEGYCGKIYCRSGLSTRHGLCLANCVGVVDSDYRGNVGIPIRNLSDIEQVIVPHQRIAQVIFEKVPDVLLLEAETLSETERGTGGFGSTGKL